MKINFAKLAGVLAQLVAAVPVVIAAVRPVIDAARAPAAKAPVD